MPALLIGWFRRPLPTFGLIMTVAAVLGGLRLGAQPLETAHDVFTIIGLNFVVVVPTFVVAWVVHAWRRSRGCRPAFTIWAVVAGASIGGGLRVLAVPVMGDPLTPGLAVMLMVASVVWPVAGALIAIGLALTARKAVEEGRRAADTARMALERDVEWKRAVSDNLHGRVQGHLLVLAARLRDHAEDPGEVLRIADSLDRLREGEVRALAHELSPLLASFCLADALQELCARIESARSVSLACPRDIDEILDRRGCPAQTRIVLYQIAQEGLVNALRWSVGSEIWVSVLVSPSAVTIEVRDSGTALADPGHRGLGSQSLDLWMLALGGRWSLTEDDGVALTAVVPLPAPLSDAPTALRGHGQVPNGRG